MQAFSHCLGLTSGLLILLIAAAVLAEQPIKTVKPDGAPNRAAWMAQGGFGVMTHYLIAPQGNTLAEQTADLNRIVDAFRRRPLCEAVRGSGRRLADFHARTGHRISLQPQRIHRPPGSRLSRRVAT